MKISLVVSDLSASGAGRWRGAVRPFLLKQAIQQLGHSVEIIGFNFEQPEQVPEFSDPSIKIIPAKPYPGFLKSAYDLLTNLTGDIVYAYKLKPTSFGLSILAKLLSRKPVFLDIDDWEISWHGGDLGAYRPTPMQLARDLLKPEGALRNPDHPVYLRWVEKFTSLADIVTTHTTFLQNRFGGIYVPNGKDTSLFDPAHHDPIINREKYGLSDYRVLMFPGAPRPYKGLEDVLEALEQLNQPDLRLVIVGGSPYDNYDNQLMEQWGHWIIKLPKISYSHMPEVVSAAHIIVVPQRDSPAAKAQFPLKLTDGMAMAKPILATRVGDIPDILGETGHLVDADCPKQIADTIDFIFKDIDQANAKGLQARQRCIDKYSIETMSAVLSNLLSAYA